MKKLLSVSLVVFSCFCAFAQPSAGTVSLQPKVGMNVSRITDDNAAKNRIGFTGGLELGYQVNRKFAMTGAIMYSMQGAKVKGSDATVKLDYINIPILANVYVVKGLALKAGIQPAFNVSKRLSAGGVSMDFDEAYKLGSGRNGKVNSFDLSVPMGLSYEISGMVFDARYNLGVTKIMGGFAKNDVRPDSRNSVFQFTIGYKFALGGRK